MMEQNVVEQSHLSEIGQIDLSSIDEASSEVFFLLWHFCDKWYGNIMSIKESFKYEGRFIKRFN